MGNTSRVDKELFREAHYLGKPAGEADRIITRRIELMEAFPGFFDPSLDVVEAGCGNGATLVRISNRFKSALGLDIVDYSEPFNRQKTQLAAQAEFMQINLETTPLHRQFDRLISFEVIEHLRNEDSGVQAYANIVKPGGLAAISVPNKWWIFETHGAKLPLLPWNRVPFFSWLPRPLHERFANARIYTRKRIINLLDKHGFDVEKVQYITAPMDVLAEGKLKRFLIKNVFTGNSTTNPFLSTSIMVFARRRHD